MSDHSFGCNCGKGKKSSTKRSGGHSSQGDTGQTQTFRLEMPNGQSFDYGSRLEAEAARVRTGNFGRVISPTQ